MKKAFKILAIFMAALLIVSFTAVAVTAAEGGDGGEIIGDGGGNNGGGDGGYSGGDGGDNGGDGGYTGGDNGGGDNGGDGGYTGGDNGGDNGGDGGYTGGDNGGGDGGYSGGDNSSGTPDYYYDDDPIWYGDAENYDYNTGDNNKAAGSVSDSTSLFNTSGTPKADVAPNTWTDITLDEKTVNSDAGSFSFIQTNTAKDDNGEWILYLGYGLVALSVLGILYFIVATISANRQNQREIRHSSGRGASESYTKLDTKETSGRTASRHSAGRYADGYESYSSRRSSKSDTGEVYVPQRAKQRAK